MRPGNKHTVPREFGRNWGIFYRVLRDLFFGFHVMRKVTRAVTVFGSARFSDSHQACKDAERVAELLGNAGFQIMTGGGPSTMLAANRGAKKAGVLSIGVNINISREETANPFVDYGVMMYYFFIRKFILTRYAQAFVVMPGGLGTLDELCEIVTLMQTGKLTNRPVVLIGARYWSGFIHWLETVVVAEGAVRIEEIKRMKIVDTPEEAARYIVASLS